MELRDLTSKQLKRAAAIKERIDELNREIGQILGAPARGGAARRKRGMSASVKRKIAAAQRARWAAIRGRAAGRGREGAAKAKKKRVSSATRAKLRARMKAYWAARKSRGK